MWGDAIIIPLLKADKSPSELGSYRPISLTSCVGKLLESKITERLYAFVESRALFSSRQAGFRKGRGTEDQILRVAQVVSDGFRGQNDQ